jgi:uncharacterized repeat protein (TIGR01451 family)
MALTPRSEYRLLWRCLAALARQRRAGLGLVLALAAMLQGGAAGGAPAALSAGSGERVWLASSTGAGVAFEVAVPWDRLLIGLKEYGGRQYAEVTLPGWTSTGEAGAPQLPMAAVALGVPFGVDLAVEVQPGPGHSFPLPAVPVPVPTLRAEWDWEALAQGGAWLPKPHRSLEEAPTVYDSADLYPGVLAGIESDGAVRQQRVIGVAAYPVQYDPAARTITVYETLRVTVTFQARAIGGDSGGGPAESASFEDVLQRVLLNYGEAAQWRRAERDLEVAVAPWAPPEPGYRVRVEQEGIYELSYDQLAQAGLPVDGLDPHTLQLYGQGSEVAIYVAGEADGTFDPQDYVLFYGQPAQSKYARHNVYWLTYGQALGARMQARDGTPSAGTVPAHYPANLRLEQNLIYIPVLTGDENLERFVWEYLYPPSRPSWSHTFALTAPFPTSDTATLRYALFGYLSSPITPDHHTQVYINGALVEDAWWDGIAWRMGTVEFSQSLLVPGDNVVSIVCPNDTGLGYDVVHVDWLELDLASQFVASGDVLSFGYDVAGEWKYQVDGFTNGDVAVFDVTNPQSVQAITGGSVVPSGPTFSLLFRDTIGGATQYWAGTAGQYLAPVSIELDSPSDLGSTDNGADYLIVTHSAFSSSLASLRDYRASQGMRAVEVDVQDVYDQFGFGVDGAPAIRSFLAYAYAHWQAPAPTYVLLVGDGHYDPKDYLAFGRTSYLPPYLAPVDPWLVETASDNRYVALTEGDTFPDMIAGRLPVNSAAEADAVVDKILLYEQSPEPGDWSDRLLFVADNADQAGDFAQASDAVIGCCLPGSYQVEKIYYLVNYSSPSEARQAIIDGITAGKLFVNYIGHASATVWAGEPLFAVDDIGALANGQKLPVMLPMTCYDGYFHYPYVDYGDSIGESIVRTSGKGAIASWSPSGLGVATGHDKLNRGFLEAAFLDLNADLGHSTISGKMRVWVTGANLDLVDTYLLFGDPALRLNVQQADVGIDKNVEPTSPLQPGDAVTYTLSVTNQGPDVAYHVVITDAMPAFVADAQVVDTSLTLSQRPGEPFAWDVQDLAPGQEGNIVIRGTVTDAAGVGWFTNRAEITTGNREVGTLPNEDAVLSLVWTGPLRVYLPLVIRNASQPRYNLGLDGTGPSRGR